MADHARPGWDEYFLGICEAVAARADCSRRRVGAVIVDRYHRLVSTGYNGSYPGGPSCLAGECPRARSGVDPGTSYDTGPGACVALHAEGNAILYAGQLRATGCTLYVSDTPCDACWRHIKAVGIARVVTPNGSWDLLPLPA